MFYVIHICVQIYGDNSNYANLFVPYLQSGTKRHICPRVKFYLVANQNMFALRDVHVTLRLRVRDVMAHLYRLGLVIVVCRQCFVLYIDCPAVNKWDFVVC